MTSTLRKTWMLFDAQSRRETIMLLSLIALAATGEGIGLGVLLPVLQVVGDMGHVDASGWLGKLHRLLGEPSSERFILILSLCGIMVFSAKNAFSAFVLHRQMGYVWNNRLKMASRLLGGYLAQPYEFHLARPPAELLRNVNNSVQELFAGFVLPMVQLVSEIMITLVIIAVLCAIDPVMTAVAAGAIGLPALLMYTVVRRRLKSWGFELNKSHTDMIRTVSEALGAIKEIKAAELENYFLDRFTEATACNSRYRLLYQTVSQYPRLALETLVVAMVLIAAILSFQDGHNPAGSLATLGLFGLAAVRLMPSVSRIAGYAGSLRFGQAILDTLHADLQAAEAEPPALPSPEALCFRDRLVLEDVTFRYNGQSEMALKGISLTIPQGNSVALVGGSGAGKTTLTALLLGLIFPTGGKLQVDGRVLSHDTMTHWRKHIAYIPQDPFLIDDTLRRNIAFGLKDEEIDDSRLQAAVNLAELRTLVEKLPNQLDSIIGDKGNTLSGGERQRVALARAFYRGADLLIMDEATSALDAETEARIVAAIDAMRGEKTIIVIAHRLSTVRHCDKIIFLANGVVEDCGNFDELASRHAGFANMVRTMGMAPVSVDGGGF